MTKSAALGLLLLFIGLIPVPGVEAQSGAPDLLPTVTGPGTAAAGEDIRDRLSIKVHNDGDQVVPGTLDAAGSAQDNGYVIDLILSTDQSVPAEVASAGSYQEDVLLTNGRITHTVDVGPGATIFYSSDLADAGVSKGIIPRDTPPGAYFLCARVDPADIVAESNEDNNVACDGMIVVAATGEAVTQSAHHVFSIPRPNSVPFVLFNVLTKGTVEAEVSWTGASDDLTVTLTGRNHQGSTGLTTLFAKETGTSPLNLSYEVTATDLARGIGWRLAVTDTSGQFDAVSDIVVTTPFDATADEVFQREKVSLRSGDLWPSPILKTRFLSQLEATIAHGLHDIISLSQACNCYRQRDLAISGISRQSFLPHRNSFGLVDKDTNLLDPLIVELVRGLTPLEPEGKIDPHVLMGDYARYQTNKAYGGPRNRVLNLDGSLELSVLFAKDVVPETIPTILANAQAAAWGPITDRPWRVTLDPTYLTVLAGRDEVEWIDVGPSPPLSDNDVTRDALNVELLHKGFIGSGQPATISYAAARLIGRNITGGVQDTGIDASHPDLDVVASITPLPVGNHGTHVAGTIAGSGEQSTRTTSRKTPT